MITIKNNYPVSFCYAVFPHAKKSLRCHQRAEALPSAQPYFSYRYGIEYEFSSQKEPKRQSVYLFKKEIQDIAILLGKSFKAPVSLDLQEADTYNLHTQINSHYPQGAYQVKPDLYPLIEIASAIMQNNKDLEVFLSFFRYLKTTGITTPKNAGIHLHIEAKRGHSLFSLKEICALYFFMQQHEGWWYHALAIDSHRKNIYCQPLPKNKFQQLYHSLQVQPHDHLADRIQTAILCHKLLDQKNFGIYAGQCLRQDGYGTIEYRYFNSSLHEEDIKFYFILSMLIHHQHRRSYSNASQLFFQPSSIKKFIMQTGLIYFPVYAEKLENNFKNTLKNHLGKEQSILYRNHLEDPLFINNVSMLISHQSTPQQTRKLFSLLKKIPPDAIDKIIEKTYQRIHLKYYPQAIASQEEPFGQESINQSLEEIIL